MLNTVRLSRPGFARHLSTKANKPPPPPPPPPPPRGNVPKELVVESSSSSNLTPIAIFISSVFIGGGIYNLNKLQNKNEDENNDYTAYDSKPSDEGIIKSISTSLGIEKQQISAKEFLKQEMEKGDDSIKPVLEAAEKAHKPLKLEPLPMETQKIDVSSSTSAEDFRFDVSRDGLADSLKIMLDVKRIEEKEIVKSVRNGRPETNYAEKLRNLREEKAEVKKHLKSLNRYK